MDDKILSVNQKTVLQFKNFLHREEKSPATIEKYVRYAKQFLCFSENLPLSREVTIAFKKKVSSIYTVAGANGMIAAVNSFLRFAGKSECCLRLLKAQKKYFVSTEKELLTREMEKLIAEAENRDKRRLSLIIQTLFATGIRVSELPFITVEAVQKGTAEIRLKGKTRVILLTERLRKKLREYASNKKLLSGSIFVTRSGKMLDRSNIWHEMKGLCKTTQVSAAKVFPHNLRHLFARTFYAKIPNLVELAGIMGHSDINTTRIYVASTSAECLRRLESLNLVR